MTDFGQGQESDIEKALTDLVMNCPELDELEKRLSQFNIFRVLRADHHEIRHSNMLAWLMNPSESHGLGDLFLRRWLMDVTHTQMTDAAQATRVPSPIEIDALEIEDVEVARELANIDLLILLHAPNDALWVVCIENKVKSKQHSKQLLRYRQFVERRYSKAEHKIYVLLTADVERPDDPEFLSSSYEIVREVLCKCLNERSDTIGQEPKFLISQYLELLGEDFVGESRSVELARKIYRRHKTAMDFILEQRKDPVSEATAIMKDVITNLSGEKSLKLGLVHKGWVRFIPPEWDIPENSGGTAWGHNGPYVVCEISFSTRNIELQMTIGKAPGEWADKVWQRAATPPFKQEWKKRPAQYIKPYKSQSDIRVESLGEMGDEDMKSAFEEWIRDEMKKPKYEEAVKEIQNLLRAMPK